MESETGDGYIKVLVSTFVHELGHNLGLMHNGDRNYCIHADTKMIE